MKLLVLDPIGCALDLSVLAISQGHEVRHFIKDDPKTRRVGENVVQRVRGNLPEHVRWADVCYSVDNYKYLPTFDRLRKDSKAVWIGATHEQAQWENDRHLGQEILRRHGIKIAPYQTFTDYDSAVAYVKKRDTRLVSKPSGEDIETSLSYVSKGPEDLLYMLDRWKKLGKLKTAFVLQDYIEGVEFGIEGWFNGEDWTGQWHESFEHKKLMNDEVGPNTGEMGTVNFVTSDSQIAEEILRPLTGLLKGSNYVGFFNVNCIIDGRGTAYPLEITPRNGWPCFNLQLSQLRGDVVESLYRDKALKFREHVCCTGVVVAIPDFPYSHITRREVTGIPVFGFDSENLHYHPCGMMKDRQGKWVTAGDYICVVTGHGRTVSQSKGQAYKNLKTLIIPNSPMYRTDIGCKVEKSLLQLHKHGLAKQLKF
jgi:phosphoribosylamine---glycine ligase